MQAEGEVWKLVWSVSNEQERRWENKRVHGAKFLENGRLGRRQIYALAELTPKKIA